MEDIIIITMQKVDFRKWNTWLWGVAVTINFTKFQMNKDIQ